MARISVRYPSLDILLGRESLGSGPPGHIECFVVHHLSFVVTTIAGWVIAGFAKDPASQSGQSLMSAMEASCSVFFSLSVLQKDTVCKTFLRCFLFVPTILLSGFSQLPVFLSGFLATFACCFIGKWDGEPFPDCGWGDAAMTMLPPEAFHWASVAYN